MALSSARYRVFFSRKEGTAFTPSTTNFFEGRGKMVLPEPEYQLESDKGKLGSGEHGTKSELQSVFTPWSYTFTRLSELAYFMSYVMGASYDVITSGSLKLHKIKHLGVDTRLLPTFTFEYGAGGSNVVVSGCVVNELSVTLSAGGTGVMEATASGFGNMHQISSGAIAANAAGTVSVGTTSFASEPLVNFKACKLYVSDTFTDISPLSLTWTGEDLSDTATDLTTLVSRISFSINNGMAGADMTRAGGYGIINDNNRNDRQVTFEFDFDKSDSTLNTNTYVLAGSQKAFEVQFTGSYIAGTDPYAFDVFFPRVQVLSGAESEGARIQKAVKTEVFGDADGDSIISYFQTACGTQYNG